jgi:hypothetical protein
MSREDLFVHSSDSKRNADTHFKRF